MIKPYGMMRDSEELKDTKLENPFKTRKKYTKKADERKSPDRRYGNFSEYLYGFLVEMGLGDCVFVPALGMPRTKIRSTVYHLTSRYRDNSKVYLDSNENPIVIYSRKFSVKAPMEKENKGKGYWIKRIK